MKSNIVASGAYGNNEQPELSHAENKNVKFPSTSFFSRQCNILFKKKN